MYFKHPRTYAAASSTSGDLQKVPDYTAMDVCSCRAAAVHAEGFGPGWHRPSAALRWGWQRRRSCWRCSAPSRCVSCCNLIRSGRRAHPYCRGSGSTQMHFPAGGCMCRLHASSQMAQHRMLCCRQALHVLQCCAPQPRCMAPLILCCSSDSCLTAVACAPRRRTGGGTCSTMCTTGWAASPSCSPSSPSTWACVCQMWVPPAATRNVSNVRNLYIMTASASAVLG